MTECDEDVCPGDSASMVKVRYLRPGKQTREWMQQLILDDGGVVVSSFVFSLNKPFAVEDRVVIKSGYRGILFDLFDRWFNVVKVYDGKRLVGYYSDIRTPPERIKGGYEATDLFIDLWVDKSGECYVLDKDEFEKSSLEPVLRRKTLGVLDDLLAMVDSSLYPPEEVDELSTSLQV